MKYALDKVPLSYLPPTRLLEMRLILRLHRYGYFYSASKSLILTRHFISLREERRSNGG